MKGTENEYNKRRNRRHKKKIVYKCDNCHEYFDEGFQYKNEWIEVGANEPTEYYIFLCEKCYNGIQ